jgi:poly(3-hydroxybutyrate) depolymerase
MARRSTEWMPLAVAVAACVITVAQPLHAEEITATKSIDGTTVRYKVVLPEGYDPEKAYPGVVALGGGAQSMRTVDRTLSRNFRDEAVKRGFIVIAPAAPQGQLFFQDGARLIPAFLDMMLAEYKIQDGKFHIAGPSNGGIAAFHLAAQNPEYFLSVTAFPGYMWERTEAKLQAISKLCVFMYVGEFDRYMWHDEMEGEAEFLRSLGTSAHYTVEKDQPHGIATLTGEHAGRLFDGFTEAESGCSP